MGRNQAARIGVFGAGLLAGLLAMAPASTASSRVGRGECVEMLHVAWPEFSLPTGAAIAVLPFDGEAGKNATLALRRVLADDLTRLRGLRWKTDQPTLPRLLEAGDTTQPDLLLRGSMTSTERSVPSGLDDLVETHVSLKATLDVVDRGGHVVAHEEPTHSCRALAGANKANWNALVQDCTVEMWASVLHDHALTPCVLELRAVPLPGPGMKKANAAAMGKRPEEALPMYEQLLRAGPESAALLSNAALVQEAMGDFAGATQRLERAVALDAACETCARALARVRARARQEDALLAVGLARNWATKR